MQRRFTFPLPLLPIPACLAAAILSGAPARSEDSGTANANTNANASTNAKAVAQGPPNFVDADAWHEIDVRLKTVRKTRAEFQAKKLSEGDALSRMETDANAIKERLKQLKDDPRASAAAASIESFLSEIKERNAKHSNDPLDVNKLVQSTDKTADAFEAKAIEFAKQFETPSSLVISGGVSLGSYQGGFLHYYTQFLLGRRSFLEDTFARHSDLGKSPLGKVGGFLVTTGASAGSINAFLAAVAGCQEPRTVPEKSLFYNVWIPVDIAALSGPPLEGERSLFTRRPINKAVQGLSDLWNADAASAGWAKRVCESYLGLTVTALQGRRIAIQGAGQYEGEVAVNRQSEKFVFKLHSGGDGNAPSFSVFAPRGEGETFPYDLYPILGTHDKDIDVAEVMKLLRASSGFPVAFEPVPLTYRLRDPASGAPVGSVQTKKFIDGGVFDNTPLLLSMHMYKWWALQENRDPKERSQTVFVEPDAIGWKKAVPPAAPENPNNRPSIFGVYLPFLSEFIATARGAELQQALEFDPAMRQHLTIPPRMAPVASGQILNFLGFYERSFRVFDFFLGMVDAWDWLRNTSAQFEIMRSFRNGGDSESSPVRVDSLIFDCFRQFRSRQRMLAAVNPDSIAACRDLVSAVPSDADVRQYDIVMRKNLIALLKASQALKNYTREAGYKPDKEDDRFFEFLGAEGFTFVDLQEFAGSPTFAVKPSGAIAVIRTLIQKDIQRLAARQPSLPQELATAFIGKAAANAFRYQVPALSLHLGLVTDAGADLGAQFRIGTSRFGLMFGSRLHPFQSDLVNPATRNYDRAIGVAPYGRLTWEPFENPVVQMAAGLGWVAKIRATSNDFLYFRHGPEGSLTVSLFQRFFLNFAASYHLDDCSKNPACEEVKTTIPVETRRWGLAWTLGFRLFFPVIRHAPPRRNGGWVTMLPRRICW